MIYLDAAATSLQKPRRVPEAAARAIRTMASPGRGGHRPAERAAETVFQCREALAALLGAPAPEQVVFTLNATHALNIAIHSLVGPGDRVVVSGYEHNAVTRPLRLAGAAVDVAASPLFDQAAALEAFRRRIPGARAVICTQVSNVFGFILPVYEIGALCAREGVPFVVDASQAAGVLDVDMARLGARFVAMPGHKGLLGPQGTGVLLCAGETAPLLAGGTGSDSREQAMPAFLPDRLEAGTHNVCGVAGLLEGVRYLQRAGLARIEARERALTARMAAALAGAPELELFLAPDPAAQAGVLSLRHARLGSEELAARLGARGVAVRAGLHCAPLAHASAGTLEGGTVRLSFSPFNTAGEVERAAAVLRRAIAEPAAG